MMPLSRASIAEATGGRVLAGAEGGPFSSVFTDTRDPCPDGLFFALKGPNFDAHAFIEKALDAGAAGVVVSDESALPASLTPEHFAICVTDTREALLKVAGKSRREHRAKVVAITGSVGKTTMKNMVAAALAPFGKVGRTPGNFNNEIGLPLTLCGMEGDEDFLVLELGMSAPGEIGSLTAVAAPDIGLVTGASASHLEFFKDVDGIADAKAELFDMLGPDTIAVANADDERILSRARALHQGRLISYGHAADASCRVVDVRADADGVSGTIACGDWKGTVDIPALGQHHALHAAGALAVVHACGLDLDRAAQGIQDGYRGEKHRMSLLRAQGGVTILDDSYNANPASMGAALQTFGELAQGASRKIAVLGSMLELGEDSPGFHRYCGHLVAQIGFERLFVVGPYARDVAEGAAQGGVAFILTADDVAELRDQIEEAAIDGSWILLKGSRGGRLERILESFSGEGSA